jgi:hypothetical protein
MKFNKKWTTHQTMLIKCVEKTNKPVLELGSGLFSTPLLHWLCKIQGVALWTYENEDEFYNFAKGFRSKMHRIRLIKDWDELDLKTHFGVVFIDHHPPLQRGKDVIKFKNNADYIILHDTEKEESYGYDKVWSHFKYRYDWKDCPPYTTVLSNFKDLSDLG